MRVTQQNSKLQNHFQLRISLPVSKICYQPINQKSRRLAEDQ